MPAAEPQLIRCHFIIRGERQCKAWAIKGCNPAKPVCYRHGGSLPTVKQAAANRIVRNDAERQALKRLRDRTGKNTLDAIAEHEALCLKAVVMMNIAQERFEELWARDDVRYEGKAGEQLRAEIALFERAMDRCNAVLSSHVKLGIADRKAKLQEAEVLLLATAVRNILNSLNLTREQMALASTVVPAELRAISGEIVEGEVVRA